MDGNTQKGWDVVFDSFPQDNKNVNHMNHNKISVVKPNEEETEYDHVYFTSRKVFDSMLYGPSDETEDNEEG